jgi:hypothetical protein
MTLCWKLHRQGVKVYIHMTKEAALKVLTPDLEHFKTESK